MLDRVVGGFFAICVFGPERAALLTAQLPATDVDATAARDADKATLRFKLEQNTATKKAQIIAQVARHCAL